MIQWLEMTLPEDPAPTTDSSLPPVTVLQGDSMGTHTYTQNKTLKNK